MFENLKAFIRHGKQANEIKKKQTITISAPLENKNLATNGNEPTKNLNPGDEYITINITNSEDENIPIKKSDDSEVHEEKSSTVKKDRNYQEVASHIVEEENLARLKGPKYPNLQNYQIMNQMGEGAFSVVYRAKNLTTEEYVAIKILRKFQMDNQQKQAVLKEVTIMRQLNHPNIVKFIEFIECDNYYYIVQELVPGGEIFTAIVKLTYFSEDLARHVITQVAKSIRYLHEEVGVVHRDIKPENLLYVPIDFRPSSKRTLRASDDPNTKEDEGEFIPNVGGGEIGMVKLADFGLSKQIWEDNTKTPCGTVGYTAPEIVRDERYSKEVDMWAIGCVLYTLLCGFPPFYDERIESLTEKVAKGEYTFLSPWWDEISINAKKCVAKLLTVDPRKRYTIDEFLKDPWMVELSKNMGPLSIPELKSQTKTITDENAHPIKQIQSAHKKYTNGLYSPAAVALRDAFDISTAVHRMGEEAALHRLNELDEVSEEFEEDEVDEIENASKLNKKLKNESFFDLKLNGASILERRKHKQVPIST